MSLPESKEADAARELAEAEANSEALTGHGARTHSAADPDAATSQSPQLPQQPRHDRALEDADDDSVIKVDTADCKEPRSSPPPLPCSVHVRDQRCRRFRALVRRVLAQLQSMDSAMRSDLQECKEADADADLADAEASSESDALSGHGARTHADAESDPDAANRQAPQLPQQPPSQRLASPARARHHDRHDRALDDDDEDAGVIEVDLDDYKEPRPAPRPVRVKVHVHHHFYHPSPSLKSVQRSPYLDAIEERPMAVHLPALAPREPGGGRPPREPPARFDSLVRQAMAKLHSIDSAMRSGLRVVPHPMVLAAGARVAASLPPPAAASIKALTLGAAIGAGVAATAHEYQRQMILQILTDAFDDYLDDPSVDHDLSPAVCAMLDELQGMRNGSNEQKAIWQRAMDLAESDYVCADGERWVPHPRNEIMCGASIGLAVSAAGAVVAAIAASAKVNGQKATTGQCSVQ